MTDASQVYGLAKIKCSVSSLMDKFFASATSDAEISVLINVLSRALEHDVASKARPRTFAAYSPDSATLVAELNRMSRSEHCPTVLRDLVNPCIAKLQSSSSGQAATATSQPS